MLYKEFGVICRKMAYCAQADQIDQSNPNKIHILLNKMRSIGIKIFNPHHNATYAIKLRLVLYFQLVLSGMDITRLDSLWYPTKYTTKYAKDIIHLRYTRFNTKPE